MDWTSIGAILGILLSAELVRLWLTRRAEKRMADTKANVEEFHALKEYNDFLQQRLIEKEERFEEQTQLVRKLNQEIFDLNREIINLTKSYGALEQVHQRLRCEDIPCPYRMPPTAETPPPPGIDKHEYHRNRKNKDKDNNG